MSIKITSDFARNSGADTYSLMNILTVKGGFSSFANLATVYTGLPKPVRSNNMLVYTADNKSFYELINNPLSDVTTASDWDLLTVGVSGGVTNIGVTWTASNTSPVLNDNSGTNGNFHICSVAGTVADANLAAINGSTIVVGDWIIYDGTNWRQLSQSGNAGDWNTLANKPSTFPATAHVHPISEITNLQITLGAKEEVINKIQTLTNVNSNTTSTLSYPSIKAMVDYIAQQLVGISSGGVTDHEALTGLLGGASNDHYHFNASQHAKLLVLIYTAPTIRFNGSTAVKLASTKEVGDAFASINTAISVTFTEVANITPANTWQLKSDQLSTFISTNVSAASFNSVYNGTPTGAGIHVISEGRISEITSSGLATSLVSPTAYTYIQTMYRVFYFMYDEATDLTLSSNAGALQTQLDSMKTSNVPNQKYSELRTYKKTGNVSWKEPGNSNVYLYMVHPDSYGTSIIAPQAFPTSLMATTASTFTYINNGTNTTYRITRVITALGKSGGPLDVIYK